MSRPVIESLEKEDFEKIRNLFERKIALENLMKIISKDMDHLYEKAVKDYGETTREFNDWWDGKTKKYKWNGENWYVDFQTQEIVCMDA